MRSFMTVVGAILIATAVQASIHVYAVGWSEATYGGYDPWALFFYGLGGAAAPAAVALVWAGLQKLLVRSSQFLSVWLIVFAISTTLFAIMMLSGARHSVAQERAGVEPAEQAPAQAVQSASIHSVGQCPISADFVTEPQVTETDIPVGEDRIKNTTLQSFVDEGFVAIECVDGTTDILFPGQDEREILTSYARFWSIEPIDNGSEGITQQSNPVPHLMLEGIAEVDGIEVLYSYRLFIFPTNFAIVKTGVIEANPNPPDVEVFVGSLKITGP